MFISLTQCLSTPHNVYLPHCCKHRLRELAPLYKKGKKPKPSTTQAEEGGEVEEAALVLEMEDALAAGDLWGPYVQVQN